MAGPDDHRDAHNGSDWTDPLGVGRLLLRSAEAMESARSPAEAINRLVAAIDAERAAQAGRGDSLDALLKHWADTLRVIGPVLPDTDIGDIPALGPYPRRQTLLRSLAQRSDTYQKALAAHLEGLTDLTESCLATFREALIQRYDEDLGASTAEPGALIQCWNETAEPRYEAWLARAQTQDRIAALVNAWSHLVETLKALADETLESLGLPSSRGMEDISAELQRQRRRHRRDIAALRAEIEALKARQDPAS